MVKTTPVQTWQIALPKPVKKVIISPMNPFPTGRTMKRRFHIARKLMILA
jgi:hypothetical protein